jgi:hypothetical protein
MDNQLVLRSDNQIAEIKEFAEIMAKSGIFKEGNQITNMVQAFVKIQAGKELGIQPFQAMTCFEIVKEKIGIKPQAAAALIKRSGKYDYRILENTKTSCTIEFFENGKSLGKETFTIQDAKDMGLADKSNWKGQPRNMLIWRCMAFGQRHYCPDVTIGTLYYTDELEDMDTKIYKSNIETPTQDAVVIEEKQVDDAYFLQSDEALEVINHWNIQYENCTSIDELLIVGDIIKEKLGIGEIDSRLTNILLKNYNVKGKSLKG